MSFSSEQKENIISHQYRTSCCRKALLAGILFSKAMLSDGALTISFEKRGNAEFAAKLVREFYGAAIDISYSEIGGRRVVLSFESDSAAEYILNIIDASNLFVKKCEGCLSAFLKGIYLASGRSSDPKIQYSLEFSSGERSVLLRDFLCGLGLPAKISEKKNGTVVYFKDGASIEDFFAYAGMNKAMFTLIDAKAEGELRRNAMRVANCETNNIEKTVNAARKQLTVIAELEKANLITSLPEELAETARLRQRYPDLSLAQLSQIAVPPISKPGLSHRLKKLVEIGEQLLSGK